MKQNQPDNEVRRPSVSLPQSSGAPDFRKKVGSTLTAPQRKKTRRFHQTPVTTLPEDDGLDEVLDELSDAPIMEEIPIDEPDAVSVKGEKSFFPFLKGRERVQSRSETASAAELIRNKSGFTESDVDMLIELGYDGELGRIVGHENVKTLKQDHKTRFGKDNRRHYRTAFGYCGLEDVNPRTRDSVLATYAHHKKRLILRVLLTFFITLLLFLIDAPMILGGAYEAFWALHPILSGVLSLCLLCAACICSARQVLAGIRSHFKLTPTPYSAVGILLPFALIYNVASFFTPDPVLRVNCLIGGILLLLSLCDVMRLVSEMRTVNLLCADGVKTVLESVEPRKKKLRQGKKLIKIMNDDIDEQFYRVRRADETTGFFRRFNDFTSANAPFQVLLGAPPAVAFICAFIALLITHDPSMALSLFMTVLLAAAPFVSIFTFFYPLSRAEKLLSRAGCALIGEESVAEYGESTTVIFPDTDLYSAEQCAEISVREGDDFRQDLRLAAILFCKAGGTLAAVGNAYGGKGLDAPVTFVRVTESGLEAIVEEKYHMIAGSADFLKKNGIRVPRESSDKALRRTPNIGVMYVAIDGVLKLSYEIEYREKPAFEQIVSDLADIDVGIAIRSCDPNLNEEFLTFNRPDGAPPIRVLKPTLHEPDTTLKSVDTGAVALGDNADIVCTLHAAHGVRRARRFGTALQCTLSVIGMLGVTVLCLTPLSAYVTPLTMTAYHLCGILVSLTASRILLCKRSCRLKKKSR
ncbi:MAG: hypothetical protein IJW29_01235 [Clostridia bacterium]|nr:hypothetical protein [Clostridia bacterium]